MAARRAKKSHAQAWCRWFRRKVDQLCPQERGPRTRRICFWTVRFATWMPTFKSSPRIRCISGGGSARAGHSGAGMKIKLDENLPSSPVADLSALGHDVDTAPAEGLIGRPDPDVWRAA